MQHQVVSRFIQLIWDLPFDGRSLGDPLNLLQQLDINEATRDLEQFYLQHTHFHELSTYFLRRRCVHGRPVTQQYYFESLVQELNRCVQQDAAFEGFSVRAILASINEVEREGRALYQLELQDLSDDEEQEDEEDDRSEQEPREEANSSTSDNSESQNNALQPRDEISLRVAAVLALRILGRATSAQIANYIAANNLRQNCTSKQISAMMWSDRFEVHGYTVFHRRRYFQHPCRREFERRSRHNSYDMRSMRGYRYSLSARGQQVFRQMLVEPN